MAVPAGACLSGLADCASNPASSRGRRHPEPEAPTRTAFQRDRNLDASRVARPLNCTARGAANHSAAHGARGVRDIAATELRPGQAAQHRAGHRANASLSGANINSADRDHFAERNGLGAHRLLVGEG